MKKKKSLQGQHLGASVTKKKTENTKPFSTFNAISDISSHKKLFECHLHVEYQGCEREHPDDTDVK